MACMLVMVCAIPQLAWQANSYIDVSRCQDTYKARRKLMANKSEIVLTLSQAQALLPLAEQELADAVKKQKLADQEGRMECYSVEDKKELVCALAGKRSNKDDYPALKLIEQPPQAAKPGSDLDFPTRHIVAFGIILVLVSTIIGAVILSLNSNYRIEGQYALINLGFATLIGILPTAIIMHIVSRLISGTWSLEQ